MTGVVFGWGVYMGKVRLENSLNQWEGTVDWGVRVRIQKQALEYHNKFDMCTYRQNTAMFISSTIGYTLH